MEKAALEKMYLQDHMTLEQIGALLGCSRQNVYHYVKKYEISPRDAEWVTFECDFCGTVGNEIGGQVYNPDLNKRFCDTDCETDYIAEQEGMKIDKA